MQFLVTPPYSQAMRTRVTEMFGIDLPIFGSDGWPQEMRGAVPTAPGLFFCGLAFQYAFSSMVLPGVGRDAAYVAKQIEARVGKSLALTA